MLRLNMAVPVTPRNDPNFSSLGLIQAAAIGLTVAPYNTTTDIEFIPNMDGFPNGRRLEDDVTRIELQAVAGVVLAAVGLWYDDYNPSSSPSPVTQQLLNVLTYTTGVEKNDLAFQSSFPYLAMPHSGTGDCSGEVVDPQYIEDPSYQVFVSSNTTGKVGVFNFTEDNSSSLRTFDVNGADADGIYYDKEADVLYQLSRSKNVIHAYSKVKENLDLNLSPVLTATSTSDFTNGREIAVFGGKLVVAQDADASNGSVDRFLVYNISPTAITLDKSYDVSQALWGIHLDGNTLYAVEDFSERVLRFDNFFDLTPGTITPDQVVAIESMVRTHGITYDREGDVMILTDVAAAASATDGALTVIRNYNTKASDDVITTAEQIIVEGPFSLMGNPVDIAFDRPSNRIYIAERAKDGGRVLGFDMPTASGDVAPLFNELFAGASAIYLANQRIKEVIQPEIVVFDPNFTDDILVASRLLGSNEVPAVVTDAIGVATVTFNDTYTEATLNVTVSKLSSAFTGLHIHNGIAGENGPVLFDFTSNFVAGRCTATFTVSKEDVAAMIDGEYYLNVHTANHPNGELRGQLALESSETFTSILDGSEEIPAVNTPALGIASAIYTSNTNVLELNILATNLSGPITGFHLHRGASGTTGPVVQNLESFVIGSTVMVKLDAGDYIPALRNGDIYVNIHTEAYPNGEIRGQLTPNDGLYFDTWMDGKQEVPSLENDAIGLAIGTISSDLSEMSYALLVDNPTGPFTAAHIHKAALGVGGGVVLDLDDDISGPFLFNEGVAITPEFLADYLRGDLYFNVHTAASPNGEVRGQLYRVARDGYVYDLCQEQEVNDPVNAGNSSGSGMFAFNRDYDEAHLMAVVNQLSSTFQGAHIHNGAVGNNGPVVFDFTSRWTGSGAFFYVTDTFTNDLAAIIQSGNAYVNVHTANNPGGEVRGQLVKAPDCPFSSAVVDIDGATFELEIYPNPVTTNVQISFDGERTLYQNSALEMRDLTGRLVYKLNNISNNFEVDMSNVQSGVYVLSLSNKAYSKSFKIVKM
jgi:Cu/Zn superoxide dismutase